MAMQVYRVRGKTTGRGGGTQQTFSPPLLLITELCAAHKRSRDLTGPATPAETALLAAEAERD